MRTDTPWFPPTFDVAAHVLPPLRPVGRRRSMRTADPIVVALARLQHNHVARGQLLHLGIDDELVRSRRESGLMMPAHPGVYRLSDAAPTPDGRRMAGVLRCGPGSRLGGWTGATQHELLPDSGSRLDISVPPDRRGRSKAFALTRSVALPHEQTLVRGVPTHTVARILLDLARRPGGRDVLEWAWRQAIYRKVLDVRAVHRVLEDHHGRPGTPALRALVERRAELVGEVRNRFELLMVEIVREAGLPEPLCNAPLKVRDGLILRPDLRIPELMLIIEGDGKDGHADVEFLLTDDQRDAYYRALGYTPLRFSYWEARRERARVRGELQGHAAWRGRASAR